MEKYKIATIILGITTILFLICYVMAINYNDPVIVEYSCGDDTCFKAVTLIDSYDFCKDKYNCYQISSLKRDN